MTTPLEALAVFAGGGAGAVARFAVGRAVVPLLPVVGFPWHTFAINVLGSFALGIVAATCRDRPAWQLFLGVGICGGFTTFSTFSVETLSMIERDRWLAAVGYVFGSALAGIAGAALAMKLAR